MREGGNRAIELFETLLRHKQPPGAFTIASFYLFVPTRTSVLPNQQCQSCSPSTADRLPLDCGLAHCTSDISPLIIILSAHSSLFSVLCSLFSVHCSLFIVHCSLSLSLSLSLTHTHTHTHTHLSPPSLTGESFVCSVQSIQVSLCVWCLLGGLGCSCCILLRSW